jgi:hypothetical protein
VQQCLIHIDARLGPIGVWWLTDSTGLRHFYPEALDPAIAERGRVTMAARGHQVPIVDWFDQLAERTAHLDDYVRVDLTDTTPVVEVLGHYRARWAASKH